MAAFESFSSASIFLALEGTVRNFADTVLIVGEWSSTRKKLLRNTRNVSPPFPFTYPQMSKTPTRTASCLSSETGRHVEALTRFTSHRNSLRYTWRWERDGGIMSCLLAVLVDRGTL